MRKFRVLSLLEAERGILINTHATSSDPPAEGAILILISGPIGTRA